MIIEIEKTDNISLHLKNIFKEGELDKKSVVEDYPVTASDGKKYKTKHYSLEAIIAVGYRVNTNRGTQFRTWATDKLKNYIFKGKISRAVAAELAIKEYEKFRIKQDNKYLSDFDMAIKSIKKK